MNMTNNKLDNKATSTMRYCYGAPSVNIALECHNDLCIQEDSRTNSSGTKKNNHSVRGRSSYEKTGSKTEKQVLISA
jgi:hypothetical protein